MTRSRRYCGNWIESGADDGDGQEILTSAVNGDDGSRCDTMISKTWKRPKQSVLVAIGQGKPNILVGLTKQRRALQVPYLAALSMTVVTTRRRVAMRTRATTRLRATTRPRATTRWRPTPGSRVSVTARGLIATIAAGC